MAVLEKNVNLKALSQCFQTYRSRRDILRVDLHGRLLAYDYALNRYSIR